MMESLYNISHLMKIIYPLKTETMLFMSDMRKLELNFIKKEPNLF